MSNSRIFRNSNGCVDDEFDSITLIFILAKIHCVVDIDSVDEQQYVGHYMDLVPFHIIPRHSQITIRDAIGGNNEAFVKDMVSFAMVS